MQKKRGKLIKKKGMIQMRAIEENFNSCRWQCYYCVYDVCERERERERMKIYKRGWREDSKEKEGTIDGINE